MGQFEYRPVGIEAGVEHVNIKILGPHRCFQLNVDVLKGKSPDCKLPPRKRVSIRRNRGRRIKDSERPVFQLQVIQKHVPIKGSMRGIARRLQELRIIPLSGPRSEEINRGPIDDEILHRSALIEESHQIVLDQDSFCPQEQACFRVDFH